MSLLKQRQQPRSRADNRLVSASSLINVSHAQLSTVHSNLDGKWWIAANVSVNLNIYPFHIVTTTTCSGLTPTVRLEAG